MDHPKAFDAGTGDEMRQVFRKIPVYTGDVSGVCSALFELGGMVVMHDPSGCNSTYNTHDEIRWYDHDSLIFISGLNDTDAILGSDDKLVRDITEAARIYSPAFIAIANSPIPYVIGMDFDAICRLIEDETGIPAFYISTNGMHDYTRGAGLAFLELARRFAGKQREGGTFEKKTGRGLSENREGTDDSLKNSGGAAGSLQNRGGADAAAGDRRIRVNLLGLTPLDFAASSTVNTLRAIIESAGFEIVSSWAMEGAAAGEERDILPARDPDRDSSDRKFSDRKSSDRESSEMESSDMESSSEGMHNRLLEDICRSSCADVNLLLSSTGLPAAEYMKKEFGIPFVAGIPAHGVGERYFEAVRAAAATGENQYPFRDRGDVPADDQKPPVCLIGEPVVMTSLAASLQTLTGCLTHVFSATEEGNDKAGDGNQFLGKNDSAPKGEEALNAMLSQIVSENASLSGKGIAVAADPCYRDILPEGCSLVRLPHLAFSGRIFLKEIPDLVGEDVFTAFKSSLSAQNSDFSI